jgi:hypothetical protein
MSGLRDALVDYPAGTIRTQNNSEFLIKPCVSIVGARLRELITPPVLSRRLRMDGGRHGFLPLALSIAISLTTTAAYAGGENFDAASPGLDFATFLP